MTDDCQDADHSGVCNNDWYYCPKAGNEYLIDITVISNFVKFYTIAILSAIRLFYFIYVLAIVKRNSKRSAFFKRPFFVNWLPILFLIATCATLYYGIFNINWRYDSEKYGALCSNKKLNLIRVTIP